MSLEDKTFDELAAEWQQSKAAIKKYEEFIEKEKEFLKEIDVILQKRLAEQGVTAAATPHGTVHTVGRSSARVMDPAATIDWLNQHHLWQDAVVLRMNSSWVSNWLEEQKTEIPGVELFQFRTLSISAPKSKKD